MGLYCYIVRKLHSLEDSEVSLFVLPFTSCIATA